MPFSSTSDAMRAPHDHLPAGVAVHAADGHIAFANRSAQQLLGRIEKQLRASGAGTAGWALVREDGSPLPPEKAPLNLVL